MDIEAVLDSHGSEVGVDGYYDQSILERGADTEGELNTYTWFENDCRYTVVVEQFPTMDEEWRIGWRIDENNSDEVVTDSEWTDDTDEIDELAKQSFKDALELEEPVVTE